MFARGEVSLHTFHLPAQKIPTFKSRVSITSKVIQTKGLQVYCFGHLQKTGGWGSYRIVRGILPAVNSQPAEASAKAGPSPLFPLHTKMSLVSPFLPLHAQKRRGTPPRKCRRADIFAFSHIFRTFGVATRVNAKKPASEARPLQGPEGALEDDGGFAVVGGALPFVEAAFLGYADGGGVIGVNEAHGAWIGEARVTPDEDGGDGFGGVAFAVHRGRENPAGFAKIFDRRDEFAMEIGEADFPGEGGALIFFEDTEAKT